MAKKSPVTPYLERVFSKKFDAIYSMVKRFPAVAPPILKKRPQILR